MLEMASGCRETKSKAGKAVSRAGHPDGRQGQKPVKSSAKRTTQNETPAKTGKTYTKVSHPMRSMPSCLIQTSKKRKIKIWPPM